MSAAQHVQNNLIKFRLKLQRYGVASKHTFLRLVASVKEAKECEASTAECLLAACNRTLVDMFADERQRMLDYLFTQLLSSELRVEFTNRHYEAYMLNTIINRGSFDPFALSASGSRHNVLTTSIIECSLVHQLCARDQIAVALAHLNRLLASLDQQQCMIDLNTYASFRNNNNNNNTNVLEQLHAELIKCVQRLAANSSRTSTRLLHANLFDPLLAYYIRAGRSEQAVELFRHTSRLDFGRSVNGTTYACLIKGYIDLERIDESRMLFDKSCDMLRVEDLLDVYTELALVKRRMTTTTTTTPSSSNNSVNLLVIDEMMDAIAGETGRLPTSKALSQGDRLVFVDRLSVLCGKGMADEAYRLLEHSFRAEYAHADPVWRDNLTLTRLNVAPYFCKEFVRFANGDVERIFHYASLLDSPLDVDVDSSSPTPRSLRYLKE